MSFFRIPHIHSSSIFNSGVDIIQIEGSYVGRLQATISTIDDKSSEVKLTIPTEASIPNGNYIIKADSINHRYIAKVNNHLITIVNTNNGVYSKFFNPLICDGSKEKPFMISSNQKFNEFIYALSQDEYSGAGFYFKQTASFQWSNDEQNDGEGLASQYFAGNYNGDNFCLSDVVINGKNTLCRYIGDKTELLLPETYNNQSYEIGSSAFENLPKIVSVVIPDSVSLIDANAFKDCSALLSVSIGNAVTAIEDNAFKGCAALTSVVIPDCVSKIGTNAFNACSALTSVCIGNGVTTIGDNAFSNCEALEKVYLNTKKEPSARMVLFLLESY